MMVAYLAGGHGGPPLHFFGPGFSNHNFEILIHMRAMLFHLYKYLRKSAFICVPIGLIFFPACQQVQKPELKGEGPLAVNVARGTAVPEYHAPAERWRTLHGSALNRGDFSQRECVLCHDPQAGCNQCHQYVGAPRISVPEASLYWPEQNHPGKEKKP
jgi:hypothetical protein